MSVIISTVSALNDYLSDCKKVAIGKTIKSIRVFDNAAYWELEMTDGSCIGFEPVLGGGVCMQFGSPFFTGFKAYSHHRRGA